MTLGRDVVTVHCLCVAGALCVVAPTAWAEWKGEVKLGFVATQGDTETTTLNFGLSVNNELERWRHRGRFEVVRATDTGETTVERYLLDYQANYWLHKWDYVFANFRYDRDLFSGFDYQVSETAGYGREWKRGDKLTLELQGGGGARQTRREDGETDNEAIVRGAFLLTWAFSKTAQLRQSLLIEDGKTNTVTESVTSLRSTIIGSLGMSFTLDIKRNSNVPPGSANTNSLTSVNLVYNF